MTVVSFRRPRLCLWVESCAFSSRTPEGADLPVRGSPDARVFGMLWHVEEEVPCEDASCLDEIDRRGRRRLSASEEN